MLAAIYTHTSLTWDHIETMPLAELQGVIRRVSTAEMEGVPDGA